MPKHKGLIGLAGLAIGLVGVAAYVAYRTRRVQTPKRYWWRFHRPGAQRLTGDACAQMQGIYRVEKGNGFFGDTAVVKATYTVERGRKIYHLSFFCEKNGTYMVCEAKQRREDVLLYGYWRKAAANGAGIVHLITKENDGGAPLLKGVFGCDNQKPRKELTLRYQQPLPPEGDFEILGHRGASRNVDFLPVSENSLAMMKMAARLGATGVEIDVRMTKDGVPVVFHDSFLSVHTISNKIYAGLLHNYTLRELKKIKLRKGGSVPTLDECLHTILHKTPLRTVWLDIKKECELDIVVRLQKLYLKRAAAMGREFYIYIGIPDNDVLKCFRQLNDFKNIPSLSELSPAITTEVNANVWAPQYTGGFQSQKVADMHTAGKKAFVWSLDNLWMIDTFISEGNFDGLVTNAPMVAAYWHYTSQAMPATNHSREAPKENA